MYAGLSYCGYYGQGFGAGDLWREFADDQGRGLTDHVALLGGRVCSALGERSKNSGAVLVYVTHDEPHDPGNVAPRFTLREANSVELFI